MTEANGVSTGVTTGDEELRKRLAELEDVAALFRASFDQSPVAQTVVDPENGRYLDVNEAFATLTGIPRSEAIGSNAARLGLVVDVRQRAEVIEKLRAGETIESAIVPLRRRGGELRQVAISARALRLQGRGALHFVFEDVTERRGIEAALQESETRLRDVVFSAGDWVWEIDAAGRLVFGLTRDAEVGGYSLEELRGKTPFDFMPPAEAERVRAIFSDVVRRKAPIRDFENWIVRKDGERACILSNGVPLLDSDGNLRGYRGVDRDITERKRIEAALKESEERFRRIFSDSPISMAIVRMDGTIEHINRQAIETFGYRPEDIPTMHHWWTLAYPDEVYRAEVIGRYMGLVQKAIAEGGEIARREYRVTCKDGTLKTMMIFGVPVVDRIFVMFEDVTERREAEEALRENRRELATWHDLVTHDLGNFSMTLLGMVEQLLDDELEPSPRRREVLQRVYRQGFEMQRLAENAKLLARLRAGAMHGTETDADLAATIDEAVTSVRTVHFDRRFDLRVDCPAGLRVRGVPFLVNIFLNLIDNALRYGGKRSPAGVEIRAATAPSDPGRVEITVRGGVPPPDELIPHLFDRYVKGPHSNGSGLGLAAVRELVVHAGGCVTARAVREERGAVFEVRIELPAA